MWNFTGNHRPAFAKSPSPGQESVWDYPRPPKCVEDPRTIVVRINDLEIARTTNAVRVLETASPPTVYIPREDVQTEHLQPTGHLSVCEWKGPATYWNLEHDQHGVTQVGWSYEQPTKKFESLRGYFSFYPAKVECYMNEERVRPQPGGFYGGWVTDEIVGPYKGEPGTQGW